MTRELVVLGIGLVAIAGCAWLLMSARTSNYGRGLGPQLAVAAVCGLVGGLIAAIPYVDAVPDDLETTSTAIAVAVVVSLAVIAVAALLVIRRRRRSPRAPAADRRPARRSLLMPSGHRTADRSSTSSTVQSTRSAPTCEMCGGVADVVDHVCGDDDREVLVVRCWTCSKIASTA